VATSGECFRGEGLVWLIGAVVCVVAAPMALANQLPLPAVVQCGWSRHCRVSSAIEESDLYLFTFTLKSGLHCWHCTGTRSGEEDQGQV